MCAYTWVGGWRGCAWGGARAGRKGDAVLSSIPNRQMPLKSPTAHPPARPPARPTDRPATVSGSDIGLAAACNPQLLESDSQADFLLLLL